MLKNLNEQTAFHDDDFEKEKNEMLNRQDYNLLGAYSSYAIDKDRISGEASVSEINHMKMDEQIIEFEDRGELVANFFEPEKMNKLSPEQVDSFLKHLFTKADKYNATDIHLDEVVGFSMVRYRVDGKLILDNSGYVINHNVLTHRLKVMAEFFMQEKTVVQKGTCVFPLSGEKRIRFTVLTLPVSNGEKMLIKLGTGNNRYKIDDIGMSVIDLRLVDEILEKQSGLVLVSGLSGSGKSSTLYALLKRISKKESNILTFEKKIYEHISGISQIEVNSQGESAFNEVIRNITEFDLDIVAVDVDFNEDILRLLVNVALSGKLVIVTTYFPTAYDTIVGMTSMGLESYAVAASLEGIIAQHLIRKLCVVCNGEKKLHTKVGTIKCDACGGLGYKGKTGVFEIIKMRREYWPLILRKDNAERLKFVIEKEKCSFENNCKRLVKDGVTSVEEVIKLGIGKSIFE